MQSRTVSSAECDRFARKVSKALQAISQARSNDQERSFQTGWRPCKGAGCAYESVSSRVPGSGRRDGAGRSGRDRRLLSQASYGQWMQDTKSPHGFELHSALSNAHAEVVQHIMGFLTMTDDQLIALEKAARLERM